MTAIFTRHIGPNPSRSNRILHLGPNHSYVLFQTFFDRFAGLLCPFLPVRRREFRTSTRWMNRSTAARNPPTKASCYLAKIGVKNVIDLREADSRSRAEERAVTAAGMKYINVPMTGHTPPTEAEIDPHSGRIGRWHGRSVVCALQTRRRPYRRSHRRLSHPAPQVGRTASP